DRELLTVSDAPRFGVREYRLKFPHFLPVLTQQAEVALEVRQHIQYLRAGNSTARLVESVLPESALDVIRYWHRQDSTEICGLVVVAGQWPSALTNEKVGIPDRLGCNPPTVGRGVAAANVSERVAAGCRVFADVSATAWPSYLQQTP